MDFCGFLEWEIAEWDWWNSKIPGDWCVAATTKDLLRTQVLLEKQLAGEVGGLLQLEQVSHPSGRIQQCCLQGYFE